MYTTPTPTDERLIALARYIKTHASSTLTLKTLAARVHLSPSHLQRRFTALFGVSPKAYQTAIRLARLKTSLRAGTPVLAAGLNSGLHSTSQLHTRTVHGLGMAPSDYRRGAHTLAIRYVVRQTPLGWLLMAATERGVCAAQFGGSKGALVQQLRDEFPNANFSSAAAHNPSLDAWCAALIRHLAGGPRPTVPLDLRGTAFQMRVWQFLTQIPRGQTITYQALARGIGKPAAVRAAASACGANSIAILIPCHRVIRGDGSLGGYRWGLDKKRLLLAQERPPQPKVRQDSR
jgi:AraC family transcriptional regulator of adaptative response/methylated-DNA-[protein]-cysteine methyltransferase